MVAAGCTMPYKIPDDDAVAKALVSVLLANPTVKSQNDLVRLTAAELSKADPEYRIGAERLRLLALERGMVSVRIEYHESKPGPLPEICPVCHHELQSTVNSTLDGGTAEISKRCTFCSFKATPKGKDPARYEFVRKSSGMPAKDPREDALEKASRYMEMALALIREADDSRTFAHHAKDLQDSLSMLISDPDVPHSIRNLLRMLETGEADPIWSRPTASVKYADRDDI